MRLTLLIALFSFISITKAQDTLIVVSDSINTKCEDYYRFKPKQLIIPGVLITAGIIGSGNDWIDAFNRDTRDNLQKNIDQKITIDNFSQFAPVAAMYALNLCGVEGKHSIADQTILLGTAEIIQATLTSGMKYSWGIRRPDHTSNNSFPSGHTATAFMSAHLLAKEYGKKYPWIAIGGYVVATGTGFFRMYNNRHWTTDVICGAGIGMLSVEAAYWLYPNISRIIYPERKKQETTIVPFYQTDTHAVGVAGALTF